MLLWPLVVQVAAGIAGVVAFLLTAVQLVKSYRDLRRRPRDAQARGPAIRMPTPEEVALYGKPSRLGRTVTLTSWAAVLLLLGISALLTYGARDEYSSAKTEAQQARRLAGTLRKEKGTLVAALGEGSARTILRLSKENDTLTEARKTLTRRVATLDADNRAFAKRVAELDADNRAFAKRVAALDARNKALAAMNERLGSNNRRLAAMNERLGTKCGIMEGRLGAVKNEVDALLEARRIPLAIRDRLKSIADGREIRRPRQ